MGNISFLFRNKIKTIRSAIFLGAFLVTFLGGAEKSEAAVWYVRTDGGTSAQCTGLVDAPYPGSGTAQACAWNHPFEALGVDGSVTFLQHIAGGDTLIIKSGSYRMGYTEGKYDSGKCSSLWPYDCAMASPPAGPDSNHPTRILGEGWDNDCTNPPELFGVERVKQVFGVFNTANIEMQCLEITDHSSCSTNANLDPSIQCSTSFPYGDYAQRGIEMRNVQSWYMKNINIHGIAGPGIRGAEVTDWTVENSRMSYNGAGGLNGETPAQVSNRFYGDLRFTNVDISWNGCMENYPNTETIVNGSCVGGNDGGFGDGLGLTRTAGAWYFDKCTVMGNVEDGLDLLYMRFDDGGFTEVKNSYFKHNGGNSLKVAGSATVIKNNILIGDCAYFENKLITHDVTSCRGNATVSVTTQRPNHTATIINNTISGQSDIMIGGSSKADIEFECDGSESVYVGNNIFQGGSHFQLPETKKVDATYFYNYCSGFTLRRENNLYYNTKWEDSTDCSDSLNSICLQDPLLVEFDEANDSYDFNLQAGSPAIAHGLAVGTPVGFDGGATMIPSIDYYGGIRKSAAVDIGMHEYDSSSSDITPPNAPSGLSVL